jgi:hypothetical protein
LVVSFGWPRYGSPNGRTLVRLVGCAHRQAMLRCEQFVATRLLPFGHVRSPEVHLGGERIMGTTVKGQVRGGVCTLHAERLSMVELEVVCFLAAFATLVDIRAAECAGFSGLEVLQSCSSWTTRVCGWPVAVVR